MNRIKVHCPDVRTESLAIETVLRCRILIVFSEEAQHDFYGLKNPITISLDAAGADMAVTGVTYFKRFRMEIDLRAVTPIAPQLPDGYHWESWRPLLLERHAWAKWESFRAELDSQVFECLGNYHGCVHLMQEIYNRDTFLANATWLISQEAASGAAPPNAAKPHAERKWVDCATIQGLAQAGSLGAIQNVGVTPAHRGRGLGRALVLKALEGFRLAEMNRVYLEVTAQNTAAIELYRSLGFRVTRTVYKAVEDDFTLF